MPLHLQALPALNDNYIWLLHDGRRALVVDPGEAAPVQAALAQAGLQLDAIFITHHHGDHTGGVAALKQASGARVIGPAHERQPVAHVDTPLHAGQRVQALGLDWQALDVPGHTAGHLAFFTEAAALAATGGLADPTDWALPGDALPSPSSSPSPILFCGDTLFCAGCGRLFEGTAAQMLASLDALAALPDATLVCCAHEYTLGNMAFAAAVEADNVQLQHAWQQAKRLRQHMLPTLPSRLALERQINPFLRSRTPAVRAALHHAHKAPEPALADDAAWFAALREWKNQF